MIRASRDSSGPIPAATAFSRNPAPSTSCPRFIAATPRQYIASAVRLPSLPDAIASASKLSAADQSPCRMEAIALRYAAIVSSDSSRAIGNSASAR